MVELIAIIIFAVSVLGITFILFKKAPVLATLPRNGHSGIKKHRIIINIEDAAKKTALYFEKQILLHKILSWIKIIVLKTEVKVDHLLHGIRKRAQQAQKKAKR